MLLLCRMDDLSSADRLDDTKGPTQPTTSVDPVTPETSIEPLRPVQGADSSLNTGDNPTQLPEDTTNAANVHDSSGKLQQETPEDKFPNMCVDASFCCFFYWILLMLFGVW